MELGRASVPILPASKLPFVISEPPPRICVRSVIQTQPDAQARASPSPFVRPRLARSAGVSMLDSDLDGNSVMHGCDWRVVRASVGRACVLALAFILSTATARSADVPKSWLDDAALHDVQFVGSKIGYAVGAHGAIWKTEDGGRSWQLVPSGTTSSLHSVCFLTDQVGWVAGREVVPFAGLDAGVLLFTENGGRTWKPLSNQQLPALSFVKFFGLEDGVVVGHPSGSSPSGILKTNDGGVSWQPIAGTASHPWRATAFLDIELGMVAGHEGHLSLIGGEQLLASKLPPQGLRSIRAVALQHDDTGWIAGDGGLLLKTTSGGVVWESPSALLPEELRNGMDFHAVEMRKESVWLAGSPGSVIWHSPNGGRSWQKQLTGQPSPLHAIRFSNDAQGVAVGDFGVILRTEDGGRSWHTVRGVDRRAAVLSMQARPSQVTSSWVAKLSGEQSYRSAIWIANRQDVGETSQSSNLDSRLTTAIERCGGNAAEIHWQLPVMIPGLEFASDKLQADWQKRTEGKLGPTLIGTLVRQLRTWRPSIVILDQPAKDDAASQLLYDAALRAIDQAGDATRFIEQRELTGLAPWKVDRIYLHLMAGGNGDANVELDEYLPTRKTTVRLAASASDSLLRANGSATAGHSNSQRLAFRWIGVDGRPAPDVTAARDFFAGLSLAPGSAARRELAPLDETDLERRQKLAQKQRNFAALTQKSLGDPRIAGQMLGQLGGLVEGMDAQQGAELLRGLASEYRERSLFELVESTNVELIRRYPQEPVALDAMRWLMQFWTSQETAWQRTRAMTNNTLKAAGDPNSNAKLLQQAAATLAGGNGGVTTADFQTEAPAINSNTNSGRVNRVDVQFDFDKSNQPRDKKKSSRGAVDSPRMSFANQQDWRSEAVRDWHSRATDLARQMEQQSPSLFQTPEVQFPLGALRRVGNSATQSDAIYRNFLTKATDDATRSLAQRELWAAQLASVEAPHEIAVCRRANEKPRLDGVLSDPCWQVSTELMLTREAARDDGLSEPEPTASLVMLAYDADFLYIGLNVPRLEGAPLDRPENKGRTHDADLSRHDRISLSLDIDRDYTTWYEFQVDQRGWTAESCWDDRRWNPKWFVATNADDASWRIEAAIPWAELTPAPPQRGTIWSAAVTRTIPTVGMQAWIHPSLTRPRPSSFGLVRFE